MAKKAAPKMPGKGEHMMGNVPMKNSEMGPNMMPKGQGMKKGSKKGKC